MIDDTLGPRTAVLEAVFVLECVAPPQLAVDRFLPPTPLRVAVDTRRVDRSDRQPDRRSIARAGERTVDLARHRKILATLVPPMLASADELARARAADVVARATDAARAALDAEIHRLRALAAVNPSVRPDEVVAAERERDQLLAALPSSRPRLDALRFIASPDFLGLRA
jgi:ATP-dependent helicase HepA